MAKNLRNFTISIRITYNAFIAGKRPRNFRNIASGSFFRSFEYFQLKHEANWKLINIPLSPFG
jgi:hypothetical protein